MAQSARQFAQLLQEGITAIADRTAKPKGVIRDELGYAVGRKGGSAIEYWVYGDGRIPSKQAEVEALARALVDAGQLDCAWLTAFLENAGYPNSQALIAELFSAAADQPLDNLPLALTPFVGRRAELTELASLLAKPDCRLITLTGPGGSGKTRLAIEVARHAQATFADGATFVALAPLTAAEPVASTIASALNLTLGGHADPQTQLLQYLRRQAHLLVLDNFEQLLPAHDLTPHEVSASSALTFIGNILTQAPKVTLLVTSRERLNMQGEWVYDLGGLDMPAEPVDERRASTGSALEQSGSALEQYSAPLLFVQTAQRGLTSFTPTATDEATILHICRLVEGMPLALELAAAWVRVLSCREIAAEIAAGLDFLTASQRNLPERHRSMRAVFDHSWQLLSAEEQQVFARFSVFRSGFTRESAEQVTGATLPALAALADKSLLSRTGEGRYVLHELARQYGAERLAETGEVAQTRNRHLTFFVALAEEAEPRLRSGPQNVQWHNRIEREHDNLRTALDWSLSGGEFEGGLRIVGALWEFWMNRAYAVEGLKQTERFLGRPEITALPILHAKALHTAGVLAYYQNLIPVARLHLVEGTARSRSLGPTGKYILALMLMASGYVAAQIPDPDTMEMLCRETLSLGQALQDIWVSAHAFNQLGMAALYRGNYTDAYKYFLESFSNFQADGESGMRGVVLKHLGDVLLEQEEYEAAYDYMRQSFAILEEVQDKARSNVALRQLSSLLLAQGKVAAAQELLAEALTRGRSIKLTRDLAQTLDLLGRLAQRQGDYPRACELHQESLTLSFEMNHQACIAYALEAFACLAAAHEGAERAIVLFAAVEACFPTKDSDISLWSTTHDPLLRKEHNRLLTQARTTLGEADFAAAWAAGTAMTVEQAVAYALGTKPVDLIDVFKKVPL